MLLKKRKETSREFIAEEDSSLQITCVMPERNSKECGVLIFECEYIRKILFPKIVCFGIFYGKILRNINPKNPGPY